MKLRYLKINNEKWIFNNKIYDKRINNDVDTLNFNEDEYIP